MDVAEEWSGTLEKVLGKKKTFLRARLQRLQGGGRREKETTAGN